MTLPLRPPASPALRAEQLSLDLSRRERPPAPAKNDPADPPPSRLEQRFWPAGGIAAAGTPADKDDPVDEISQVPRHD